MKRNQDDLNARSYSRRGEMGGLPIRRPTGQETGRRIRARETAALRAGRRTIRTRFGRWGAPLRPTGNKQLPCLESLLRKPGVGQRVAMCSPSRNFARSERHCALFRTFRRPYERSRTCWQTTSELGAKWPVRCRNAGNCTCPMRSGRCLSGRIRPRAARLRSRWSSDSRPFRAPSDGPFFFEINALS